MPFDPLRDPADTVTLAGRVVPGIVVIKGLAAPRDWEERRGFGMIGSLLRYKGQKLSHFILEVRLFTEEHWDDWLEFGPVIRRPPQPNRNTRFVTSLPSPGRLMRTQAPPLSIQHPLLEEYRIRRVVVEDVVAPVQDDTGVWTIEIKLIQYQPPIIGLSDAGGSSDEPTGSPRIAARRATLAARRAELDGLATGGNR